MALFPRRGQSVTKDNSLPFEIQTKRKWAARRKTLTAKLTANPKENHKQW